MKMAGGGLGQSRLGRSPEIFRPQRLTLQHGDLVLPSEFRAYRCEAPACHAERAKAAIRTEQGERGQADVPANAVEDNVYLARSLTGPQRPVPAAVVDDHVGPERAGRRELSGARRAAGGGGTVGTNGPPPPPAAASMRTVPPLLIRARPARATAVRPSASNATASGRSIWPGTSINRCSAATACSA